MTISIIGLLAGLSIPAIKAARETGEVGGCMSNIRQLTMAMLAMGADNGGRIRSGVWANDSPDSLTNGALWSDGYVREAKVFLCPHGRKFGASWRGSTVCHYSLNVSAENPKSGDLTNRFININQIQYASKAIMLFEEAAIVGGIRDDSRADMSTNRPNTGDAILFTQTNRMANHRKKGCVSFYDGSALSFTSTEWLKMLDNPTKTRRHFFGSD